jgi:hypothetical protein
MAMFEGFTVKAGSRSNTRLVVSHGDSPAEKWIADPALTTLFNYEYGGPGQKNVVIAKGHMVALSGGFTKDYETGKNVPTMTLATGANACIGMVPFNISKHDPRWFNGNQPAILTREYVELPYIADATLAANVKYGAVIGSGLEPGDYLKVTTNASNKGKLTKWDKDNDADYLRVAQALAVEKDQEPLGWLKWAMWDELAKREDDASNVKKNVTATDYGWPYDAAYRDGQTGIKGYGPNSTDNPFGIPGLTDGAERSKTVWTKTVVSLANAADGTVYAITLDYKNVIAGSVVVTLDAVEEDDETFVVNEKEGVVTYTLSSAGNGNDTRDIVVTYKAYFPGTLPGWDFEGSLGAVRLLLKF